MWRVAVSVWGCRRMLCAARVRYEHCECAPNNGTATQGACDGDCWSGTLPVFLLCLGLLMFSTFMARHCAVECVRNHVCLLG